MSLNLTDFVLRPGPGKTGKPITVRSNFFEISSLPTINIHHYDVKIGDEKAPPAVNRKIWKQFEDMGGQGILKGGILTIYDGRKNVFSPKPLNLGPDQLGQFEVEFQDGVKGAARTKTIKIQIQKANEINMTEVHQFLQGKQRLTPNSLTGIMAMDVLIRHMPSLTFNTVVGRSFYTPNDSRALSGGLEVWQGFYQSARPGVGKMYINLDVSATAFYEGGRLPDLAVKIIGRRTIDDLRRGLTDRDRIKLEKAIKNLQIQIVHRGEKKFKYKITKLTPSTVERTKFKDQEGKEMTVSQYFTQRYGMRLSYPFLPCVVVKKDMFLPMEVCEIVPGQRCLKKLDDKQTADMIKFTCQKPDVRANKIKQGFNLLETKNPYMQQFGVTVKPEMSTVKARVLPTPAIAYSKDSKGGIFTPQGGAWNLVGKKVAQGATLRSWSVVNFHSGLPNPVIQNFLRTLGQVFIEKGMNVVNRTPTIIHADPQGDVEKTLKEAWLTAGNQVKSNPQLILCIMPNKSTLYNEIKRVTETIIGVPTQCVLSKKVSDNNNQYCTNVSLKVNVKLGGMNVYLPQSHPFLTEKPTIIIGADVTHPAPGDLNTPSLAALTGTLDARAARYSSVVGVQASRKEMIDNLAGLVKELLKNFFKTCGKKPERILFYRDGVSEGQFAAVLEEEISQIHAACASLDKGYRPKLTFVVVQKRHHARFFPLKKDDADRSGNCQPGTVIDTDIVHPFEFDFYLQSHSGLQGTSRPTHYHVLYDENKFTPDSLQELSYRLTYIYGRATRSVSLVPPVYYAHLLAFRARFHKIGSEWSDSGATSETMDADQQMAGFARVKTQLDKVMYYM
ncbi:Piwi domain-containing protein [Phascolomyces articulosus]|uniref:Piwi domain-containing protein n=1 Tax=Phascolomyces articulosus TaxID=60185 RepID=A0AAD5JKE9_9FUNG|nr:Piwi domain-containing protein [Phascolomyces articulosus]